jgi:hypothetical protein
MHFGLFSTGNFSATVQAGDVGRINSQTKDAPEKGIYIGVFELKSGNRLEDILKISNYDNLNSFLKYVYIRK